MSGARKSYLIFSLYALFILCLGARITSTFIHEVLGAVLTIVILVHAWDHLTWFFNFTQGFWSVRRLISTFVNWLLLMAFLAVVATGVLLSPELSSLFPINIGMGVRQLHSSAAYWLLIIVGVHTGLHGPMIARKLENIFGQQILAILSVVTVLFALIAIVDRMLLQKLFLGFSFDFWDPQRPASLYFLLYSSVSAAIAIMTHSSIKILNAKNSLMHCISRQNIRPS